MDGSFKIIGGDSRNDEVSYLRRRDPWNRLVALSFTINSLGKIFSQ